MTQYKERINRVCDYIQYNLDSDMSVEALAEIAALSKFHFHRQFAGYVGVNVTRYIQLMRLRRASYRVAFSSDKIIDIALDACFESPEAFTRAFRRVFKQSPSAFRRKPDWQHWHKQFDTRLPAKENRKMNVSVTEVAEEKIVYISHRGDYRKVFDTAAKFIAWRKETGLSPIKKSRTYGIVYSDPKNTPEEEFRFDICGSVAGDIPANEYGVQTGSIPAGKCAVVRHIGNHDGLEEAVYHLYMQWLPQSEYETRDFPVYFHYHNFIHEVDECDLITDIYLPIK